MIGRNSQEPTRDEILAGLARAIQREIVEGGCVSDSLGREIAAWGWSDAELAAILGRLCQNPTMVRRVTSQDN